MGQSAKAKFPKLKGEAIRKSPKLFGQEIGAQIAEWLKSVSINRQPRKRINFFLIKWKEFAMNQLIGLSLSFCVNDIARGNVEMEQVEKIIAGTMAGPDVWDELLAQYKRSYWSEQPEKCEKIARTLMNTGRIEQPRLTGGEAPHIWDGHWQLPDGTHTRNPNA